MITPRTAGRFCFSEAPGTTRSIAFPHAFVVGDRADMLRADARMSQRHLTAAEDAVAEAIADWQSATGPARGRERHGVRLMLARYRVARDRYDAARDRHVFAIMWRRAELDSRAYVIGAQS